MPLYEGAGMGATANFLAGTSDLSIADALRVHAARASDSSPDGTIKVGSDSKIYARVAGAWKSVTVA